MSKVVVGSSILLAAACMPPLYKRQRRGHEYFSSERPEAVDQSMQEKEQAKYAKIVKENTRS